MLTRLRPAASLRPAAALRSAAALSLLAGLAAAPAHAGDNMMDQMVRKYCLKAVNDEVKASGKPAPDGMANSTCECVVQQMKKRQSIEQAKVTCKNQAAKKYNL